MMASNLLSKFLPSNTVPSIYEDMRAEEVGDPWDVERGGGTSIDEENLGEPLDDYLDNHHEVFGNDSHITASESTAFLPPHAGGGRSKGKGKASGRPLKEDEDNDVPASLLIEGNDTVPLIHRARGIPPSMPPTNTRRATSRNDQARWEAVQAQQRLHQDDSAGTRLPILQQGGTVLDARQKALWTWLNAYNLDNFMAEVYSYYRGAGIWCICLERLLNVLTVIFVAVFTAFLTQCVNYSAIPSHKKLSDALVPKCTQKFSFSTNLVIWILTVWVIWKIFIDFKDVRRLWTMHDFYLHLLNIPDSDMQTISWQDIVGRIMALRDAHPLTNQNLTSGQKRWMEYQSRERLDAHDIANRLMRRENYLIALFNKDVLDLTLPFSFLRGRQIFSKTIEWNLSYCILDFMFNDQGQIKQLVLKDTHRQQLCQGLRQRFIFAGVMNVIFGPFIILYLAVLYFFKYFNEYQKNPSAIGSRQYTPLAEWKFREFNELPHLFNNRVNMSYPFASRYINQFPKVKTVQLARFIAFIAGAIVSVLFLATIIDPELFLAFEITPNRTAIFFLGVFGGIWAFAHGTVPDDNLVFDPEYAIRNVIEYTHYMPTDWEGRLHSYEVNKEFSTMYKMKALIFLEELFSIMLTPFVLWWSLPQCSDRIVDFFREFTIHVDGLGYVCSFAVFDFKKGVGKTTSRGGADIGDALRDDYYSTKHGKMAASFYGFIDNYVTNPKTGIPGHIPPGLRNQQFHPPPSFPGLPTSPAFGHDYQQSRDGRTGGPLNRIPGGGVAPSRTPRFPAAVLPSPMASMLLDPHHQPSPTIIERGRSVHGRRPDRSRFLPEEIREDEEDEDASYGVKLQTEDSGGPFSGLDESRWETSPSRNGNKDIQSSREDHGNDEGVLGMMNQFLRAQTSDGKGAVPQI